MHAGNEMAQSQTTRTVLPPQTASETTPSASFKESVTEVQQTYDFSTNIIKQTVSMSNSFLSTSVSLETHTSSMVFERSTLLGPQPSKTSAIVSDTSSSSTSTNVYSIVATGYGTESSSKLALSTTPRQSPSRINSNSVTRISAITSMSISISPTTIGTNADSGLLTPTLLAGILVLCALIIVFVVITMSVCLVVFYWKKRHRVQSKEESPYPKRSESLILGKG